MYKTTIAILFFFLISAGGCTKNQAVKEILYVGTQSGGEGREGLYVFEFDRTTDSLTQLQIAGDQKGPDFQALHPAGTYLYSDSDEPYSDNTKNGTITAFSIDQHTGMLTKINDQSAAGRGPAHVSVDPKGRFVYVSNYGSGSLSVFAINNDGSLTEAVDTIHHEGSSVNKRRQSGSHVHSIIPSPDGRFIYASDLGTDKIYIYAVDPSSGKLMPAMMPYVETEQGSGPRHFTIHQNNKFAYALEEISSDIAVFRVDQSTGTLSRIQRTLMVPDGFEGNNKAADIHISPDGKFLYASNRGHDSLAIYKINKSTGRLTLVGFEPTRGRGPRNFLVDKQGKYVLVANKEDNNVVVFQRDEMTGKLRYTGEEINVPTPVCLTQLFLEL